MSIFLCNICGEEVENISQQITLKCNPNHTYCYDCIFDWYYKNRNHSDIHGDSNIASSTSCPICRKNGGYLPIPEGKSRIENVHIPPILSKISGYSSNSKCDCMLSPIINTHPCFHYAYYVLSLPYCLKEKFKNELQNKTSIKMCHTHYQAFKKGDSVALDDNIVIESFYKKYPCEAILTTNNQCNGNSNILKNGELLMIKNNNQTYCVCKKHKEDYEKNKALNIKNVGMIIKNGVVNQEDKKKGGKMKSCKKKVEIQKSNTSEKNNTFEDLLDDLDIFEDSKQTNDFKNINHEMDDLMIELHTNLTLLKNIIETKNNEKTIQKLEMSLQEINELIQLFRTTKEKDIFLLIRDKSDEFTFILNEIMIEHQNTNDIINEEPKKIKKEELKEEKKENTKMITFDLYNYQIDPYCNVKLKNGKLCKNIGNVHYNLKCGNHSHGMYMKELFFKENNK